MARMIKAELRKQDGLSPEERAWFVVMNIGGKEESLMITCPIKTGFPDVDDVLRSLIADSRRVPGSIGFD